MSSPMPAITIVVGLVLILLGAGTYATAEVKHVTALIPAFFGLFLVMLGIVARNPARTKHAMHVAVTLALVGALGTVRALPATIAMMNGATPSRPPAMLWAQSISFVVFTVFIVLCVRSFIAARRARAAVSA